MLISWQDFLIAKKSYYGFTVQLTTTILDIVQQACNYKQLRKGANEGPGAASNSIPRNFPSVGNKSLAQYYAFWASKSACLPVSHH